MNRALIVCLPAIVIGLTGATCSNGLVRGIPAQCLPIGFEECKSHARWVGDPNDPASWDNLAADTINASREETRVCEQRRKALEQCLRRLDKEHVIDLGRK